ncbi:2Fe-2S iron-sulfur cluster protein [Hoeflea marina]|uniref:2Fe-2S iron-sulfur cluster protein n=1 Tax=Hoeflea marina TaxID=274592 RepID=A0A317PK45_9HYPH|nr:(2Fe-2S)-binding protein [Hoeflea marina]PWV98097.1 2Fe-2S iron-sulfur cluster protein [Hoeflea marina]
MVPSRARRIEEVRTISFEFEGLAVQAQEGDSVAAALTAAGIVDLRDSPVSGAPRGIYCMMGACFDCLVEIDGQPNRQACMCEVREGLVVRRQQGRAELEL